jgi:SAM-dependent methyltransferase
MCARCRGLERHRFLALLLEGLAPMIATSRLVVDVGPTSPVTRMFRRMSPSCYVRVDLNRAPDRRNVDVQASLTALPFPDRSVDFMLCYHVLEHIRDDAAAMGEIARTLGDAGMGVIQVPWRDRRPTDEDPDAPEAERIRRFGQADHVRMYGDDFEQRLRKAGLQSYRLTPHEVAGDRLVGLFRLVPDETVWLVRRAAVGRRDQLDEQAIRFRTLQDLAAHARDTSRTRAGNGAGVPWDGWKQRLLKIPTVRSLAVATRPVRKRRQRTS